MGKKHVFNILDERQKKPFESFADIESRVHLMPNPLNIIVKRIVEELMGEAEKHYLFTRPPPKKEFNQFPQSYERKDF
jgi:putative nucleotide binding protein